MVVNQSMGGSSLAREHIIVSGNSAEIALAAILREVLGLLPQVHLVSNECLNNCMMVVTLSQRKDIPPCVGSRAVDRSTKDGSTSGSMSYAAKSIKYPITC